MTMPDRVQVNIDKAYKVIYEKSPESDTNAHVQEGIILMDVRGPDEYIRNHLYGSDLIPHADILASIEGYSKEWKGKTVITVCRSGGRSGTVSEALQERGIESHSIEGGMIAWTQSSYPYWGEVEEE